MEIATTEIKRMMNNYRKSQAFVEKCPDDVRVFLEPTVNLAGDFICDVCYERGLDPVKVEDE